MYLVVQEHITHSSAPHLVRQDIGLEKVTCRKVQSATCIEYRGTHWHHMGLPPTGVL